MPVRHDSQKSALLFDQALNMAESDADTAFNLYKEALKYDPYNTGAHVNIALIYLKKGELLNALFHYQEALRISPQYPLAWFNLGRLYEKMLKPKDAEKSYRRAVSLDPQYVDARYNLALLLKDRGNIREAIKELEICIPYLKFIKDPFLIHAENALLGLRSTQILSTKKISPP